MSTSKKLSAEAFPALARERRRIVGNRPPRRYFLIVCEGKKTEPNYFDALRQELPKEMLDRIEIVGEGANTQSLVDRAEALVEQRKRSGKPPYYHVWVVFDKDSFPDDDFDNAIASIERKTRAFDNDTPDSLTELPPEHWHSAWSNEAFELWYILHFQPETGGAQSRDTYKATLAKHLGRKYEKNAKDMFRILHDKTSQAIANAEAALKKHAPETPHHKKNPATTVHKLVKELFKYISRA